MKQGENRKAKALNFQWEILWKKISSLAIENTLLDVKLHMYVFMVLFKTLMFQVTDSQNVNNNVHETEPKCHDLDTQAHARYSKENQHKIILGRGRSHTNTQINSFLLCIFWLGGGSGLEEHRRTCQH